jgi:hypothetical protein
MYALALALAMASPAQPQETTDAALQAELLAVQRDLADAEMELERLKRHLPPAFDVAVDADALRRRARYAGLPDLEVRPLPDGEPARPSVLERHRVEVSGRGSYQAVHAFFTAVAEAPRLIDLEAASLEGAAEGAVGFNARLALPTFPGKLPSSPPPAAVPAPGPGAATTHEAAVAAIAAARQAVLRRAIGEMRHRLEGTRTVIGAVTGLMQRRALARLTRVLGLLSSGLEDHAVALTGVEFGEGLSLTGVALGARAREALRPALEQAGLEVTGLEVTPAGRCHAFTVAARLSDEPPATAAPGDGLFDVNAESVCRAPRAPAMGVVAVPGEGGPEDGVTLRLRDVEVADAFWVLHEVTGESFVLGGDLEGRLGLDLDRAAPERVWEGLARVGLGVGPGPIRRVSRGAARPAIEATYTADRVSLSMRRAKVVDLLRLFRELTGLTFLVPKDLDREVSVFTRDAEWDRSLEAILAAAGLAYRIDGSRVLVGPEVALAESGGSALVPLEEAARPTWRRDWWNRTGRLEETAIGDLALAGVGRSGGRWQAWAYGPSGLLTALVPGQALAGGSVGSAGSTGVTFRTAQGPVERPFPP